MELIRNALGDKNYNILLKSVDFDSIIPNAIASYKQYMNSPQQKVLIGGEKTYERFVPRNISDVVRLFQYGGYENISNFIKSYSKQKISERIKLKDLITLTF